MSEPSMSRGQPGSVRPYADLVEATYGQKHSWLVKFLRQGYSHRHWDGRAPFTNIYILDSVDGVLRGQIFEGHRSGEVHDAFLDALNMRPSNSKTRLVLLQGSQIGDTNGAYIGAIGWKYQLDPFFLSSHFRQNLQLDEGTRLGFLTELPLPLPSKADYMTIATSSHSFMTTKVTSHGGQTTVIMLGVDYFLPHRVTDLYNYLLDTGRFPQPKVVAADTEPCHFLLEYIQESLGEIYSKTRILGEFTPQTERLILTPYNWELNMSKYRFLIDSKESITRYVQRSHVVSESECCLIQTLPDYEHTITESRANSIQLQIQFQNYSSSKALEETEKSLEQADAVRRITLIGLVFIPMNFATSFFGMNFKQLGNGTLNIGYFFLTAITTGLTAFLLAASIKPVERFWKRARNNYGEQEFNFRDNYEWVTKSTVVWWWFRKKVRPADTLYGMWNVCAGRYMDDLGEYDQNRIPHFKLIVLRMVLKDVSQSAVRKVRALAMHILKRGDDDVREVSHGGS